MSPELAAAAPAGTKGGAPRGSRASELRALARLAIPLAATQAGFALMGLVDTAVVGRLGAGPLGAVGLANGLFIAVAIFGIGIMLGLDPLLSQALGAGDERRAAELTWQGVWLAALASTALAAPLLLAPLLLAPMGVPAAVAQDATAFLLWRLPGLLPLLVFTGLRSSLQARSVTRPLLVATAVGNVCNAAFDVVLVFGGRVLPAWAGPLRGIPQMGAAGAGLSTTLCTVVQLGVLLLAFRGFARGHPGVRKSPHPGDLRQALRVGLPVALQMGAEVSVFALVGLLAGRLGEDALAAHQVAISLASFTFCFALGIGQAGSVRVGRAVGARDTAAARRAGLSAFAMGAGFMFLAALGFWLFPRLLAGLLTDQDTVVRASVPLLAVTAIFQISDGVQGVGAGVLRGAGDTRFAFVANVFGHYAIGLPIALLLGFGFHRGIFGLWWGLCTGLSAVAISLLARFVLLSSREIATLEPVRQPEPGQPRAPAAPHGPGAH